MTTIQHVVCGVIPSHMLERVAAGTTIEASENARATLEHMRELATGSAHTLLPADEGAPPPTERRRVYDAQGRFELPGILVLPYGDTPGLDTEAREAWNGSGATLDFYERVYGRRSIDDLGLRLDATVHYGTRFENAMWNGRQMPGKIWYAALIDRLRPDAGFADFVQATIDIAGEIYGRGGRVQRCVIAAWTDVGLHAPVPFGPEARRRRRKAA